MIDYQQSGVNIKEGYKAVQNYKTSAKRTMIPGVLSGLGSFAGMFEIPKTYTQPVLVSGTDGVGTKLDIAFKMGIYDTIGIDCVAMCVNDILCHGAKPLFFLDYIACGKLDATIAGLIVKGVAEGCILSGATLLGGETAEMPGFYAEGIYDIAGFAVGIVEKTKIIDGSSIKAGDALVGIASSGIHSNGFSLIRKIVPNLHDDFNGQTIGKVLLEPTKIYVKPILALMQDIDIHGMVHITGGGFYENLPRMFPKSRAYENSAGEKLVPVIQKDSWPIHPIFSELVKRGAAEDAMFHTFNMGIGFVLAVDKANADETIAFLERQGFPAYKIGYVERGNKDIRFV